jgi:hypothetical protein
VQNLPASNWSDLVRLECFDRQCASVCIHKLNLVAVTVMMYEDDCPHVAGDQAVRWQVLQQCHGIQFLQHFVSHAHLSLDGRDRQ